MNLFSNRNFLLLVFAAFFSTFGDTLRIMAITFWVFEGTDQSPLARSILLLCGMLPPLLISPFAGVFSDRMNRRNIMLTSDIVRAVLSTILIFTYSIQNVPLTIVLVALQSIATVFFEPAQFSLIPQVVKDPKDLVRANSIIESGLRAVAIFAPPLAALIYFTLGGTWSFGIDAITFVISAIIISFIKVDPLQSNNPIEGESNETSMRGFKKFSHEGLQGLKYLRNNPVVRNFFITTSGLSITSSVNQVALIFLITQALRRPAADLAWVFSISGAAQLLTAFVVAIFANKVKSASLLVNTLAVMALTQFGMGLAPNIFVLGIFVLVGALANAPYSIAYDSVLQEHLDEKFTGRVFGIMDAVDYTLRSITLAIAGFFIMNFGSREVIVAAGILGLVCTLLGYFAFLPSIKPKSTPSVSEQKSNL